MKRFLFLIPVLFLLLPCSAKTITANIGYTYSLSRISGKLNNTFSTIYSNGISFNTSYNFNDYIGVDFGGCFSFLPSITSVVNPGTKDEFKINLTSKNNNLLSLYMGYSFIGSMGKSFFQTSINCNFDIYNIENKNGVYIGPLLHWCYAYPFNIFTISAGFDLSTSIPLKKLLIIINNNDYVMNLNTLKFNPFLNIGVTF